MNEFAEMELYVKGFKTYMEFDVTDNEKDGIMRMLLEGVISTLENEASVLLGERQVQEVVIGIGKKVFLPHYPVANLLVVEKSGNSIPISEIKVTKNIVKSTTSSLDGEVIFTYVLGWSYTKLPSDLKVAIFKYTEKLYNDSVMEREGLSVVSNDIKQRASYNHDVPEYTVSTFRKYAIILL